MNRIVIAGGTGLIGRALARDLVGSGHQVTVLSRSPAGRSRMLATGVNVEIWDGTSTDGWGHLVDGSLAVVNLAGESIAGGRWTKARKQRIRDSRVAAASAIASAVTQASVPPQVVVHGSAVGYYGPRGSERIEEDATVGGDFLAEVTAAAEDAIAPSAGSGTRLVKARTGVVFDGDDGALPKMLTPFRLLAGGPIGSGDQFLPWIHIDDEVGALRFLIQRESAGGIYNLTAPEPVTNAQFALSAGKAMGRPSFVSTPGLIMRLAFGEMSTVLLDGQRAVPRRLLDAGYRFRFSDVDAALSDLLAR